MGHVQRLAFLGGPLTSGFAAVVVHENDPNDACSVGVAALRSPACHRVRADDHAVVLRAWSRRHRQLSSLRTQAAYRLHAVLCEITPGGVTGNITANRAAAIPGAHHPADPAGQAWLDLADEHLADLRRIDDKLAEARKKITPAVKASGTTLTEVFGVGPVIAATVIGDVADGSRFPTADKFAPYNGTAPIEVSSGSRKTCRLSMRGNRRLNHAIYARRVADARRAAGPGGQPGNDSPSSAAGSHPEHQLFGQATHEPATTLRRPAQPRGNKTPRTSSRAT